MKLPRIILPVAVIMLVAGGLYLVLQPKEKPVSLRFYAYVGDDALVLNEMRYHNPGGDGRYKIRDFQFYISNVTLSGSSGEYKLADSYHLLRFDGESPYAEIKIPAINLEGFNQIRWGVGVDPEANGTVKIAGDLDPNNRMAWNWHVGYKFILLEGRIEDGDELVPLVYHVGFDENYTPQTLPLQRSAETDSENIVRFKVDIGALFAGEPPFDMTAIPSVKFDPDDSTRIASGFGRMISPESTDSP